LSGSRTDSLRLRLSALFASASSTAAGGGGGGKSATGAAASSRGCLVRRDRRASSSVSRPERLLFLAGVASNIGSDRRGSLVDLLRPSPKKPMIPSLRGDVVVLERFSGDALLLRGEASGDGWLRCVLADGPALCLSRFENSVLGSVVPTDFLRGVFGDGIFLLATTGGGGGRRSSSSSLEM
jgi:hypothetical protein